MARVLTSSAVAAKARAGPLRMLVFVALVCLVAGYFMGTAYSPLWQRTNERPRPTRAPLRKNVVWQGSVLPAERRKCEDSCTGYTRNGICDEGRPTPKRKRFDQAPENSVYSVKCDLGTDCGDCGPWVHTNTAEATRWQPIKEIKKKNGNFSVFARQLHTPHPFWMAYTDPDKDHDVSNFLHTHGLFERGFTWIWYNILSEECLGPMSERRVVVDVGANFGYYSLLAASEGCRVVAWEPVPHFAAFFKYSLLLNNMTHAVQLHETIVGDASGSKLTIVAPQRGIWGTAGIDGKNIDPAIDNEGEYDRIEREVERVDDVVKQDVLVMKVDVEGFEPMVMRSAKQLLLKYSVKHVFMEYSPGVAERDQNWTWFESNPAMLMGLVHAGYTILHLGYEFREQFPEWEGKIQLPDMEEVTEKILGNDIQDAWRLQEGTLGCPIPEELQYAEPGQAPMFGCGSMPEGFDPHSFRATFGHNTNIWAFKLQPWFANIAGPASLVPLNYDVRHKYFVQGGKYGAGRRPCLHLTPDVQVMHRCPCTDKDECGYLEQEVKKLASKGKLPPFPLKGRRVNASEYSIQNW